ncbi:hypothetical protein PB2503_03202 [Parvularcula bermudensis HTCC2503]|uniref:Uncharacterized protein n=1 Tax=Parvularcula bermudensis (strain ATCC BAA-594 / HTCC2503 / KCTC 12087) TaxID=314260 RepID=E0TD58_PARBH|nr:hypothetical protein [Parvularcula bermudensis]ADM08717.1 hypothetical protein PB2503_03202 [Parvularcula bermudensis HTCC2503]
MSDRQPSLPSDEQSLLDRPFTRRLVGGGLVGGFILTLGAGVILGMNGLMVYKPHFDGKTGFAGLLGAAADHFPAFYASLGILGFLLLVAVGRVLAPLLSGASEPYGPKADKAVSDEGDRGGRA